MVLSRERASLRTLRLVLGYPLLVSNEQKLRATLDHFRHLHLFGPTVTFSGGSALGSIALAKQFAGSFSACVYIYIDNNVILHIL